MITLRELFTPLPRARTDKRSKERTIITREVQGETVHVGFLFRTCSGQGKQTVFPNYYRKLAELNYQLGTGFRVVRPLVADALFSSEDPEILEWAALEKFPVDSMVVRKNPNLPDREPIEYVPPHPFNEQDNQLFQFHAGELITEPSSTHLVVLNLGPEDFRVISNLRIEKEKHEIIFREASPTIEIRIAPERIKCLPFRMSEELFAVSGWYAPDPGTFAPTLEPQKACSPEARNYSMTITPFIGPMAVFVYPYPENHEHYAKPGFRFYYTMELQPGYPLALMVEIPEKDLKTFRAGIELPAEDFPNPWLAQSNTIHSWSVHGPLD